MIKNDKSVDDGGPAFATSCANETQHMVQEGMSLRDYFAAAALATMKLHNSWSDNTFYWDGVARCAYICADAMIRARKEPRS